MSEQKPTEHTDTPKTTRTVPSMASMAAAIHAAPVRAPQKPARASQTSSEKPGDTSTAEPGSKWRNAHKNSSRKNNASRPENQKRERRFELGSVVEASPGFSPDVWDARAGF